MSGTFSSGIRISGSGRPVRRGAARSGHKQKRMRERNAAKMAAKAKAMVLADKRTEADVEAYWHSDKRARVEQLSVGDFIEREAKPDKTENAPVQLLHEECEATVAVLSARELVEGASFIELEEGEIAE